MLTRKSVAFVREHRRRQAPERPIGLREVGELRYLVPQFERVFDYAPLGRVLKLPLASSLAEAHVEYLTRFSKSYAVASFLAMRRFAEFAGVDGGQLAELKALDSVSAGSGANAWKRVVSEYIKVLEVRHIALTTFAEEIGNLFRGLDELVSRGLAAQCDRPLLPKNYHASGKHRPGLVEQSSKNPVAPELLAQLEAHIDSLNLPIQGDDARDLLRALAAQIPVDVLHDEVAVAEAIFKLNAKAIGEVRAVAEETFLHWRNVWRMGQAQLDSTVILERPAIQGSETRPSTEACATSEALFSPEFNGNALGSFLMLFQEKFGSRVPPEVEKHWPKYMKRAYRLLGGREYLDACFTLHRRGVAAAVILYLVDSGANVSTALSLTTESEQQTDDPNFVDFISFKDRAGPAPVIKQLPLHSHGLKVTAAQALREVKLMTQYRRSIFPDLLGDTLFVFSHFEEPSILTNDSLSHNFRYMLRDRKMPTVWTPSAIRVAVAVEVSGKSGGDLDKVGRKLSHTAGSATTPIYALRLAARLMLTRKIREYQTLLEAAFSTHAPRGPQMLGYSDEAATFLVGKAVRTGLGFLCRDATARGGKYEEQGASCPEVGVHCADCRVSVFLTDVDSLAEMIALNDSLTMKLDATGEGDLDAWMEKWRDLYAYSSAVIQKATRSRFAYLLPAARRKAKTLLATGFDPVLVQD